jgi:hypothetical protein
MVTKRSGQVEARSHPALALLLPTKCPDLAREKASLLVVEFLVRQEP